MAEAEVGIGEEIEKFRIYKMRYFLEVQL